jgi:hypothetical protein
MRFLDEEVEIGIIAEAWVDPEVVRGVIAVGLRGEDRAERYTGGTQFDGVIEPPDDAPQSVLVRRGRRLGRVCAHEPERIDMPPDCVLHPCKRHESAVYAPAHPGRLDSPG